MPPPNEINDLIGKPVLYKWDGDPLDASDFGWYIGWVANRAIASDVKKRCNFDVWFCNNVTNDVIPAAQGQKGKDTSPRIPCGLTPEVWDIGNKCDLLKPPLGLGNIPHGTNKRNSKGKKRIK